MSADIIRFPTRNRPSRPAVKVTIHCELDGTAIVAISPCPAGVTPRRLFLSYDDAWPYADALAKAHAVEHVNGNASRSVTVAGPEAAT